MVGLTASFGHTPIHLPQPTHLFSSIPALPSVICGASWAQILTQAPQPTHRLWSTAGLPEQCISIFPAREPQPIPIFFKAPPNPAPSCPLKCVREINTSASITALPILASFTYSPSTGTSASSVPFSPSAIITWHPVENGVNPFSYAVSI